MTTASPGPNRNKAALRTYLEANRGHYTDEALTEALLKEGYSQADVEEGFAELARAEASKPVRARARRLVLVAYGLTYAILVFGMLGTGYGYGSGIIGSIVLAVALGLALALALWLVRRSTDRGAEGGAAVMAGILAIPIVLLVIVAGLCVATGLPFHPTAV